MKENNKTVLVDWEEKITAEVDPLTEAYAELGKAFYEYRFEEPTPELLLYFDRISALKQELKERSKRNDYLEEIQPKPAAKMSEAAAAEPAVDPSESRSASQSFQSEPAAPFSESEATVIVNNESSASPLYQEAKKSESDIIHSLDELPDLSGKAPATAEPAYAAPSQPAPKYCPECGSRISADDLFCGNCGFRLK